MFADADGLMEGWSCPGSTECCRFGITGREPYVTSIELVAIQRAVAARGGPRALSHARALSPLETAAPRGRRKLPIAARAAADERTCPLLDSQGKCSIYASRPLGCRTFFCERASAPHARRSTRGRVLPQEQLNHLVAQVRRIASAHRPGGDLGRGLTSALLERFEGRR